MNQDKWNEWIESEATEYFFKYLTDLYEDTATQLAIRISDGMIVPVEEQIKIATECDTFKRITEVTIEEIEDYYEEE